LELTITLPPDADPVALLGSAERNLKIIREALGVNITARGGAVRLSGEGRAVNQAAEIIAELTDAARQHRPMSRTDLIERIHRMSLRGENGSPVAEEDGALALDVYVRGTRISPKTAGQKRYLRAIADHDMVFCSGPAGTGKTYLAVAAAVSMLKHGTVRKLVLVRPAVEAGEKLGFLPGDMQQKVNPYLRPLLDSLHDMMPFEQVQRFMSSDLIEVVPLAFMRGRTLNDAVIILDEAQNTTKGQMLMFLTRMGNGSKVIATGDTSQIDLEPGVESGLIDAARRLIRVPGIAFVTLEKGDIVRHSLVQRVVEAYGQEPT
jgi:phosphate starvation-inducible protein PhoH and related proteins